jgi:hypothetical protein
MYEMGGMFASKLRKSILTGTFNSRLKMLVVVPPQATFVPSKLFARLANSLSVAGFTGAPVKTMTSRGLRK